ncbi:MAG: hypothetical protein ACRCV9_16305 [Burkholderiaceae bacterium]
MTSKNYNWHKAWERLPSGRLRHVSGLEFEFSDELGWSTCDDTLVEFQAFEQARGVPMHDLLERGLRLAREAHDWAARNPEN